MELLLSKPIEALDSLRSLVLRTVLRNRIARHVYGHRPIRHLFQFCLGMSVSAVMIALTPVLAFYLGPLVLGMPHLIASLRFTVPNGLEMKRLARQLILLMVAVIGMRMLEWAGDRDLLQVPEALAIFGTVWIFSRRVFPAIFAAAFYLGLSAGYPFLLPLLLLIGHNFIAFLFWWQSATNRAERKVVVGAGAWMMATSVLLIMIPPDATGHLGKLLFGYYGTPEIRVALLKVFLLSQSAHYFIWLKAIPEVRSTSLTPGPFRYTFAQVKAELGVRTLIFFLVCTFGLGLCVMKSGMEEARILYLTLSSFHGFSEIGALISLAFIPAMQRVR